MNFKNKSALVLSIFVFATLLLVMVMQQVVSVGHSELVDIQAADPEYLPALSSVSCTLRERGGGGFRNGAVAICV